MNKEKKLLRIDEALDFYKETKEKEDPRIYKIDLARVLFKRSRKQTQAVNMSNLITGKTEKISPFFVKYICEKTGIDANFLFGIDPSLLERYENIKTKGINF